jgi:hypothetical protein
VEQDSQAGAGQLADSNGQPETESKNAIVEPPARTGKAAWDALISPADDDARFEERDDFGAAARAFARRSRTHAPPLVDSSPRSPSAGRVGSSSGRRAAV